MSVRDIIRIYKHQLLPQISRLLNSFNVSGNQLISDCITIPVPHKQSWQVSNDEWAQKWRAHKDFDMPIGGHLVKLDNQFTNLELSTSKLWFSVSTIVSLHEMLNISHGLEPFHLIFESDSLQEADKVFAITVSHPISIKWALCIHESSTIYSFRGKESPIAYK